MFRRHAIKDRALNLRAGELVEIRSREEILATLDAQGRLDAMPFMPEMLKYCGKQIKVHKSAHKTCDTIGFQGARKLKRTVHLEGTRCDGPSHDGCQAACTLFWKDAWLRRVEVGTAHVALVDSDSTVGPTPEPGGPEEQILLSATRDAAVAGEVVYRCQATELNRASEILPWWDFRQYVKDVTSGNVGVFRIVRALGFWLFKKLLRIGAYRALIWTYDSVQQAIGGIPYPFKYGTCDRTPSAKLDLQPGELVCVRSQADILTTVNARNRNRGLSFDEEMVGFCGGTYRVRARVERIINERTGKMTQLGSDCIILEGVTCQSNFKNQRLFCPRSIFPYWREIWLQRIGEDIRR
jgi:hypothetical protein